MSPQKWPLDVCSRKDITYLFEINSYCHTDQMYVYGKFERPFTGGDMSIDMQTVLTLSPKIQSDQI